MGYKSSKSIENKCTHYAFRLFLKGKHAHHKGNTRHVRSWSKAIGSNFSCFFYIEISKNCIGQVFPLYDDYFRCVSTAPSIAIARNDHSVGTPLYMNVRKTVEIHRKEGYSLCNALVRMGKCVHCAENTWHISYRLKAFAGILRQSSHKK